MSDLQSDTDRLYHFLEQHRSVVVLTGAGISARSGIPTYRDARGTWLHSEPIQHQEFLRQPARRKRYWARSLHGWPAVRDARPNEAHLALSALERRGKVKLLITQNVDRLHQRAGSHNVVDLHGRLDRVRCLDCATTHHREHVQEQLLRDNRAPPAAAAGARPDGDADVHDEWVERFAVPACYHCGGVLMPDVVFFGGTVPPERVTACSTAIEEADALLAIGSSLQVYSGYRFCRQAQRLGKTLALINPGTTRADAMADLKLHRDCAPVLRGVASQYASDAAPAGAA